MGKSPKPLTILVHPSLIDAPEVQALAAKGHTVLSMVGLDGFSTTDLDLIFGPTCWRLTAELLPYLDLAIRGARGIKYPKKGTK